MLIPPSSPCLKILVTSQKGGVGKSTIAANLAAYFAKVLSKPTTLLDFDPHGSSSSWVNRASPAGVAVQHHPLPLSLGDKRALIEARMHLRRATDSCDVVITDLTWSEAIEGELLFEFDLVLTPVSLSAIEIAATISFLSRFRWVFDSKVRIPPTLLICPSRVTENQLYDDPFSQQRFPISFMLAPPVVDSQEAKKLFEKGYLFDAEDYSGKLFSNFASAIEQAGQLHLEKSKTIRPHISDIRRTQGESKILNRFMMQRKKPSLEPDRGSASLTIPSGFYKKS